MRLDAGVMALATFVVGCDGGGSGDPPHDAAGSTHDAALADGTLELDAPSDGGEDIVNPGQSSNTLQVTVDIVCRLTARSGGESTCNVDYDISVELDSDGTDVDDAVVEAGPLGAMIPLGNQGFGDYEGTSTTGWPEYFAVSVMRGSDFLTGVVIEAPRPFELSLAPDPPQASQAATLSWSPSHPGSYSLAAVTKISAPSAVTYRGEIELDSGTEALPASTFPDPGNYIIELGRATRTPLSGPSSLAVVVFIRRPIVEVVQ